MIIQIQIQINKQIQTIKNIQDIARWSGVMHGDEIAFIFGGDKKFHHYIHNCNAALW